MPLFEVKRALGAGYGSGSAPSARLTTMSDQVVVDFITAALLDARGYQVRGGTIVTGLTADTPLADTAAELCADAATGTAIIPIRFHSGIREVATATTLQVYVKAVGVVSSAGTAFTPLPLLQGGAASVSTARMAQTGGVTVTAEAATTTRRLFGFEGLTTQAAAGPVVTGYATIAAEAAQLHYIGVGPACVYAQVASTTASVLHFSTLEYLEYQTLMILPS